MKIGEKIKTVREIKKLSQEDMAHKLGLAVHTYARLEQGKSRIYMQVLEEIAQILDMDVIDLLSVGTKNFVVVVGENGTATEFHNINCEGDNQTTVELLKAKDEVIEQQKQHIASLKETIEMLKQK